MTIDQTLLDLREARDYIEEFGLHKGDMVPDRKRMFYGQPACMAGALMTVIVPGARDHPPFTGDELNRWVLASSALECEIPEWLMATFNDRPETTKEQVLEIFDKAIACREKTLADRQ